MELRHLRYFIAVAELENVSRAALKLHVSQPALSRQIRDIEEELGFPLLERTAKSIRLTEAGRVFLPEARAVLQRVEEAVNKASAVASGARELHIGFAMSPTVRLLPQTLRAFQAERPAVRVKLHDLSTEEMLAGLRSGKLHLALMVRSSPRMMRGLHSEKLASLAMRIATSPNHPFARMRSVTLDDLARQPLIALSRRDYPDYAETLAGIFAKCKRKPRVAEEHDNIATLIAAVESGSGVALLTDSIGCIAGERLKLTRLSPSPPPLVVVAAWAKGELPAAVQEFLDCARKAGAELQKLS